MSINATTFLAALPGKRASVTAHGVTVASVLRSGRLANGALADNGMYAEPQATIYPLSGAFGREIVAGDLFLVADTYGICFSVDHINEDTIDRCALLLLQKTCTFASASIACNVKATSATTSWDIGGATEATEETIVTHTSLIPSGTDAPQTGDSITLPDGIVRSINSVSTDFSGAVLHIKCTSKGAPSNG